MRQALLKKVTGTLIVLVMATAHAQAQTEAGTVAALQGRLEVQRAGNWRDARIGAPVFVGDRLRTGPSDRAKIVFRDDTVIDLAPGTEIVLDTQVFDPAARKFQSLIRLFEGKIRAWVSDHYRQQRARYEVETLTAIAGVRGTEFIMLYNPRAELSEVVGIADQVEVFAKLAVIGSPVRLGPQFYTQVQKGRFPTPPERLGDTRFRQYLEGLAIVGTGRRDGLNVLHPAAVGQLLTPEDVPRLARPGPLEQPEQLSLGAPEEFLGLQVSPDVGANTQPLLEFRRTPPGAPSTGGVRVEF